LIDEYRNKRKQFVKNHINAYKYKMTTKTRYNSNYVIILQLLSKILQLCQLKMPGGKAPRFTQKPSIKQTSDGHLLMECNLEAQPLPKIKWSHGTDVVNEGGRYLMALEPKPNDLFLASLLIKV